RKGGAPTEFDRLATGRPEHVAADVQCYGGLAETKVRHNGREIGTRDNVEQASLVAGHPRPDLAQAVHRVHIGDDGVMARPGQTAVAERTTGAAPNRRRLRYGDG